MDNNVLQYLVDERKKLISFIARRLEGNIDDAEDVLSEYQIAVIKYVKDGSISQEEVPSYVIASLCRFINKFKRNPIAEVAPAIFEQLMEDQLTQSEDPYNAIRRERDLEDLEKEIEAFTTNTLHRNVLKLHYLDGLKRREVTKILDIKFTIFQNVTSRFKQHIGNKNEFMGRRLRS